MIQYTVIQYCAGHRHHSLQLVTPHRVVTLEGLVGEKGRNTKLSIEQQSWLNRVTSHKDGVNLYN